jgi:hypothetical protein
VNQKKLRENKEYRTEVSEEKKRERHTVAAIDFIGHSEGQARTHTHTKRELRNE